MNLTIRQWLALKISVGVGAVLYGFGAKFITYLTGLKDQGGGWGDRDGISIAILAMLALGDGMIALGTLLTRVIPPDPPPPAPGGVAPEPLDIDLYPSEDYSKQSTENRR